jgi:hypothetical protein
MVHVPEVHLERVLSNKILKQQVLYTDALYILTVYTEEKEVLSSSQALAYYLTSESVIS